MDNLVSLLIGVIAIIALTYLVFDIFYSETPNFGYYYICRHRTSDNTFRTLPVSCELLPLGPATNQPTTCISIQHHNILWKRRMPIEGVSSCLSGIGAQRFRISHMGFRERFF
jgi:hypothetical protein